MNRLQRELGRLYLPLATGGQDADGDESGLIDAAGRVRAMVLELARPADWSALSAVWKGVQIDLELPAPAIAVSGKDGYQLWFSLCEPVPAPQAWAFLHALRERYLAGINTGRIGLMPTQDGRSLPPQLLHSAQLPARPTEGGRWAAFVAPDLAPVFAQEPWLDLPPNPDGQSALLSGLETIKAAEFERAMALLGPASAPAPAPAPPASGAAPPAAAEAGPTSTRPPPVGAGQSPKRFLLGVMNDDSVALDLRIEAAKALLPYFDESDPR